MAAIFVVIYAVFAVQALFGIALLLRRSQNAQPNRILAGILGLFALSAAYMLYLATELYREDPRWLFAIDSLPALYGPLFYLYTRSLLRRDLRLARALPHFVLFVVSTAVWSPRIFLSGAEKLAVGPATGIQAWMDVAIEWQGLAYFGACLWLVRAHTASLPHRYSSIEHRRVRWLAVLLGALAFLWSLQIAGRAFEVGLELYLHGGLTITLYAIAYMNAVQPELFQARALEPAPPIAPAPAPEPVFVRPPLAPELPRAEVSVTKSARYQKSKIAPERVQELAGQVRSIFESKRLYLDPTFDLTMLAEELEAAPHQVSQVLNEHFGRTFYDYVNFHRVEEVKRRLVDPRYANEKVLSIGLDCGFSSKSTLNANFKKWTEMTPTEYRDRNTDCSPAPLVTLEHS